MRNTDTSEEVPDFLYGKHSSCMTKAITKYKIMDVRGKKPSYNSFTTTLESRSFPNSTTLSLFWGGEVGLLVSSDT